MSQKQPTKFLGNIDRRVVSNAIEKITSRLLLIGILGFAATPIYWMVVSSLRRTGDIIREDPNLIPEYVTFTNYISMWDRIPLVDFYINSIIIASVATIISLFIGSLGAYALSRYSFRGNRFVAGIIIGTQMIPRILILLPIFLIFLSVQNIVSLPMRNTYHGMIYLLTTMTLPFSIWMMWGYMDSVPEALEEAARIDGCNRVQVLRHIVFPLIVPGLAATGLFVFLIAFNEVLFSSIFAVRDVTPFSIGIQQFQTNRTTQWGEMMAAATSAALPLLIILYTFQKQIIAGLTEGGLKS